MLVITAALLAPLRSGHACSRVAYFGAKGQVATGRNMDWFEDMHSNLWVFPPSLPRHISLKNGSIKWSSKYGSVVASGYEAGTADGMNTQGLVANLLFLEESDYGQWDGKREPMVISAWAQYVLDNYATVSEAVTGLREKNFAMLPVVAVPGIKGTVHLSISDASGDSAVLEYLQNGKLVIHHGREYQVMTNSPAFDDQLLQNKEYWKRHPQGGYEELPGTAKSTDRFTRALFYINAVKQSDIPREAIPAVFSVIRNVAVPIGVKYDAAQPNMHSTIWRTVADQKNKVYYFENTLSPYLLWVDLKQVDFSHVGKLTLDGNPYLGGDQTLKFKEAVPFDFLTTPW